MLELADARKVIRKRFQSETFSLTGSPVSCLRVELHVLRSLLLSIESFYIFYFVFEQSQTNSFQSRDSQLVLSELFISDRTH